MVQLGCTDADSGFALYNKAIDAASVHYPDNNILLSNFGTSIALLYKANPESASVQPSCTTV
ncbi:hypothetical protein ACUOA8_47065, partial [Escherichia sp. SS-MK2]